MRKFNEKGERIVKLLFAAMYSFIDEKYNLKSPVHSLVVIFFLRKRNENF